MKENRVKIFDLKHIGDDYRTSRFRIILCDEIVKRCLRKRPDWIIFKLSNKRFPYSRTVRIALVARAFCPERWRWFDPVERDWRPVFPYLSDTFSTLFPKRKTARIYYRIYERN